jgi:hypothetical protein
MGRILERIQEWEGWEWIAPYIPEWNFITVHYTYFIGTCLITSIIFYVSSTPAWSITYTDSLFLVISAMTEVTTRLACKCTIRSLMLQ